MKILKTSAIALLGMLCFGIVGVVVADAITGPAHVCSPTGKVCTAETPSIKSVGGIYFTTGTNTASLTSVALGLEPTIHGSGNADGGILYGANGIYFITTNTETASATGTGSDTGTGTATASGTFTGTASRTATGTGTMTQVFNPPTTGTYTNNSLTGTLVGTVTKTGVAVLAGTGTLTLTNTAHTPSTFTETGTFTVSATDTVTGTSATTGSGTNTTTGTAVFTRTGLQTATWIENSIAAMIAYSGTFSGTSTASGTATASGTGTWTATSFATATSATTASNPTISYDQYAATIPGGDLYFTSGFNSGNYLALHDWPGGENSTDPSASPTPGSPASITGSSRGCNDNTNRAFCNVVNRYVVASPVTRIAPGDVKIWLWATTTSDAQLYLYFDTCTGGYPVAPVGDTIVLNVAASAGWQLLYATLPMRDGLTLPANYQLCVAISAYTSSGTPTVTLGATSPHYSRINGPWISSGAHSL